MAITFPNLAPNLTGTLVKLSQLDESVIASYIELVADPEVAFWTASTETYSPKQLKDWLSDRPGAKDRLDWAVFDATNGEFSGEVVLNEYKADEDSVNLRIALRSQKSSKGLGSQAVKLVCDYAFHDLAIKRITLDVLSTNERAIRAYLKAGFTKYSEVIESGSVFDLMELQASGR